MPDNVPTNSGNEGNVSTSQAPTDGQSSLTQVTSQGGEAPKGPMKLSDDMEVIWDGAKEPVKFSNLRGLQSQFTKVSQARAELDKQVRAEQAEKLRLQNALRVALGQTVQGPKADPYAEIKERPYVSGQQFAQVLSQQQGQFAPVVNVLQAMAAEIQNLKGQLGGINRDFTTRSFDTKMRGFLDKIGLDAEEYMDDAKIFYLAHEGDDLDNDFPELFKKHVEKQNEREKRIRQRRLEAAKNKPFVPGKGGLGSTTGEGGFTGKETPAELADKLWGMLQGTET